MFCLQFRLLLTEQTFAPTVSFVVTLPTLSFALPDFLCALPTQTSSVGAMSFLIDSSVQQAPVLVLAVLPCESVKALFNAKVLYK